MIYPETFEKKVGFDHIRHIISELCLSNLGKQKISAMTFYNDAEIIKTSLEQTREFRRLMEVSDNFPLAFFFDMREQVARLRLEGTYLEEEELWNLKRSLETIHNIIKFLNNFEETDDPTSFKYEYPKLQELTDGIRIFPNITNRIGQILDQYGRIKDSASQELAKIRHELKRMEGSVSHTLNSILRSAQMDGLIEKDVTPTMRDGRLVIPMAPAMKRKLSGIVHDESASGKTVFIEPTEVVEANNRIHELEAEERKEIIRILKDIAITIRPFVHDISDSYRLLADVDFIRAKALLANKFQACEPELLPYPVIDWAQARHPLLQAALESKHQESTTTDDDSTPRRIVPLDITLTSENRLLIISGPNAGGKSVCLKTTGLLQYMLQCGLSIPVKENSKAGVFSGIMIDIGDEQSLSDDLSTYSGHLNNMKQMIRNTNASTLILIDEFGTGTEPGIGGAIAEAVLGQFCKNKTFGVITTHYQNLKEFADKHEGVINGAMLYDRHQMKALFQLQIGRPGSSFAIEIARKIGLPEAVINEATEIVGQDYIQSDKYLQDIVRDKRYWESKRQQVHQREKDIEKTISKYEAGVAEVEQERKAILRRAKEQAEELLRETNRKIENTIRDIREAQAEKEATKRIREDLRLFEDEVRDVDQTANDEAIARKIAQIQARKERHEKRKREKEQQKEKNQVSSLAAKPFDSIKNTNDGKSQQFAVGSYVRIKGTKSIGRIESLSGKTATIIFGDLRSKMNTNRLELTEKPQQENVKAASSYMAAERSTRETIDSRRENFHQDIDVRGMRGDESLLLVQHFIDDAILVGVAQVRILHGKGNGILRQLIRQYLSGIPNVRSYRDEHVQFGGAGITVVEFD